MADRNKVVGLLQEAAEYFRECRSNASFGSKAETHFWELQNAAGEAAGLLKEQAPVPVKQREFMKMLFWCCGSCGAAITDGDKFCRMCGKRVKWNENM